ncbi:uncharacterized protein [Antedon mediterranea]|uniref:uncharacterized protein n=1 Tax=Antedon mediterranea TaxID=105859 RepID=UPI003AF821B2
MKFAKHCGTSIREFQPGQSVMVRDYRNKNQKWIPAQIQGKTGPLSYTVDTGLGTLWRRHADQLHPTMVNVTPTEIFTQDDHVPEILNPTDAPQSDNLTRNVNADTPVTTGSASLTQETAPIRRYPKRNNIRPPKRLDL